VSEALEIATARVRAAGVDDERRRAYAAEVARLVRPGGCYLLFVHMRAAEDDVSPPGVGQGTVEALFGAGFDFVQVEPGTTTFGELQRRSAWYELRRLGVDH
jgi:hypothetical protein